MPPAAAPLPIARSACAVDLGGDLGPRRDVEIAARRQAGIAPILQAQHVGRAAAEMDVADRRAARSAWRRSRSISAKQARDVISIGATVHHGRVARSTSTCGR